MRRKHRRMPVISSFLKPVLIRSDQLGLKESAPGIIVDLSAGGLAMITFVPIYPGTKLSLNLNLPGLIIKDIVAHVLRVKQKYKTYMAAIRFDRLNNKARSKINRMADDYDLCETKLMLGEKKICSRRCSYFPLCSKSIKIDSAKKVKIKR